MSSHGEASSSHRARHREDPSDERDRSRDHRRGSASDRSHRHPRDDGHDDRREGRPHRREGRERRHRDDAERSRHYAESHGPSDRHRRQRRRRSASSSSSPSSSSSSSRSPSPPAKQDIAVHPRLEAKNVEPLTPSDYYSHSAPFRHWLFHDYAVRHPRSARLDDLSSKDSHRLFDEKFASAWNRGKLDDEYYEGKITSANLRLGTSSRSRSGDDASKKKARGWAFLATRTAKEEEQISMMRDSVDSMTNGTSRGAQEMRDIDAKKRRRVQQDREQEREAVAPKAGSGSNRGAQDSGWGSRSRDDAGDTSTLGATRGGPSAPVPIGPSHPSDHRYDVESSAEKARLQAQAQRRASRRDEKDRQEEVAPRATGRDAVVEKRREKNRSNREFAEGAGAGGGMDELDENDLMGGGDSFADALAAKRAAAERRHVGGRGGGGAGNSEAMSAREAKRAEREAEQMEKRSEYRRKEDATMDMFKKMAAERFG
ncbi:unnamed protein product [Jaminaea pallidilutea]